jgi:hypothetical protein
VCHGSGPFSVHEKVGLTFAGEDIGAVGMKIPHRSALDLRLRIIALNLGQGVAAGQSIATSASDPEWSATTRNDSHPAAIKGAADMLQ